MCGIAGGFSEDVLTCLKSLSHRGPDAAEWQKKGEITFVHTRLAIVDLDSRSNQPFSYGDTMITYNGELWNYKEIRAELESYGLKFLTTGDTEVVAASLFYWDEAALNLFQGMFAVAWTKDGKTIKLARDRFGEVPVHYCVEGSFAFASEIKGLQSMARFDKHVMLEPGCIVEADSKMVALRRYYDIDTSVIRHLNTDRAASLIRNHLKNGIIERTMADVPICVLLSGGVDSSIVASVLSKKIPGLTAYVAVWDEKARDLRCARELSNVIGIKLVEVKVPEPTVPMLFDVIKTIEMPYKAQVEIGFACSVLADKISEDGFKVVYSGEGSDELWASYGFAYHALQKEDWHEYRKKLFMSQARKNFARCNKIFMRKGIECRLPFLNTGLVEAAISLTKDSVSEGNNTKKALQLAFKNELTTEIFRRPKTAFQDGMGIKDVIKDIVKDPKKTYAAMYSELYDHEESQSFF